MKKLIHLLVLTLTLLGTFATPMLAEGTDPGPKTAIKAMFR